MHLSIQEPGGFRQAVTPFDGIENELSLIKSLIMTLASESQRGARTAMLKVDLDGIDVVQLITLARMLSASARANPSLVANPSTVLIID